MDVEPLCECFGGDDIAQLELGDVAPLGSGPEPIANGNGQPSLHQCGGDIRANESGAAGYENHARHFTLALQKRHIQSPALRAAKSTSSAAHLPSSMRCIQLP